MPDTSAALDTCHLERSPLNSFAPGTGLYFSFAPGTGSYFVSKNNRLISVTAETFQDPIGPCGPLEQLVDSARHPLMALRSSSQDHTVVGCCNSDHMIIISARLRIKLRAYLTISMDVRVMVSSRGSNKVSVRGLG